MSVSKNDVSTYYMFPVFAGEMNSNPKEFLGSNLILKDNILGIQIENPLIVIEKAAFEVKAAYEENARLEPAKNALNKGEMREIYSKSILLSG